MSSRQPLPPGITADDLLYHYTSLDALVRIVTSRQMYATYVRYMNDSTELNHALNALGSAAERLQANPPAEADDGFAERLKLTYPTFQRAFESPSASLKNAVVCFTRDGNLLSQWRAYCPSNRGVSIGIKAGELAEWGARQGFTLKECIYDEDRQRNIAEGVLETLIRNTAVVKDPVLEGIENPLAAFAQVAAFLKHPKFAEEQEWRLVTAEFAQPRRDTVFREGRSMLIPYRLFDLPQDADGRVQIAHVILGPTPHVEQAQQSVSDFLWTHDVMSTVEYCDIPLREA